MVNVKICGITRMEDAIKAEELGAWAIGFIFYPKSPRYITPENASKISKNIKIKKIGVFVNEKPEIINKIAEIAELDYVQLHGNESLEDCAKLNIPFIKNIRNINETDIYKEAFAFLIDATDTQNWGGTGKLADWKLAKSVKEYLNKQKPLILSGGISSDNIKEALRIVKPDFVDISSSLETEPGIKDHTALSEFLKEIKNND